MPAVSRDRLIIFTRYPEPGTTKTRLIPELGAEGSAELQRQMTEHILSRADKLRRSNQLAVEIRYEGGNERQMMKWLGPGPHYRRQGSGDIGLRMTRALQEAFEQGCENAVIVGSDIPDITTNIVQKAFEALKQSDLVLGPAADGGYYLIGVHARNLKNRHPQLFRDISWGTENVLHQTLTIAENLGINYCLLDTLRDVDRPEDLGVWYHAADREPPAAESTLISVIIPTLNEAKTIEATLSTIKTSGRTEILVVDGGSRDQTAEIAKNLGAKVLSVSPSKAAQMNAGAAQAAGDVLLFLHADTCLPENFEESLLAAATQEGFCAGAFSLGIASPKKALRLIERVANWRSRFLQMPYGDQALFVSRNLFQDVGGYPDYPIMEDFELIRRLKKKGKITILIESVQTSPRRWLNLGILRTWLLNQLIIFAYYLGISPDRLSQWYRRAKGQAAR